MKKEASVILPISLPVSLDKAVKARAEKKHGERKVSFYFRKLAEADLKKK